MKWIIIISVAVIIISVAVILFVGVAFAADPVTANNPIPAANPNQGKEVEQYDENGELIKKPPEPPKPPEYDEEKVKAKERERIKTNRIKSLSGTIYAYKFGKLVDKGFSTYKKFFNENGDISEEHWFDINGAVTVKVVYVYDANKKKTGEDWFNGLETLVYKDIYRFDDKGRKSEEVWYDVNGTLVYKVVYDYDSLKGTTKRIGYRSDGKRLFQMDCTYNAKDLSLTCVSSSGTYFQNFNDDKMQRFWYTAYGSMYGKELYIHNKDGQIAEYVLSDSNAEVVRRAFKYDEKGNATEEILYSRIKEPVISIRYTYEYF